VQFSFLLWCDQLDVMPILEQQKQKLRPWQAWTIFIATAGGRMRYYTM
jgi:hypothetical protein